MPVRKLVEALGGNVGWDPATGEATVVRGPVRVQLRVGSRLAQVNGRGCRWRCRPASPRAGRGWCRCGS
ncbi:hypothetical protein caldi_14670 [Caldinitratiruptor microaerophilus]|uniref:Copper amine oxidase-like N-terminal domain-containing protein n=1 Tax=Caldinitratiruptor microaerophilus TaxID=671077 RepID=A0AA35CJI9_9FIRM|nr:hypothetical protein caldi_14670 [Caldinitratiruptor microaerophilus]